MDDNLAIQTARANEAEAKAADEKRRADDNEKKLGDEKKRADDAEVIGIIRVPLVLLSRLIHIFNRQNL